MRADEQEPDRRRASGQVTAKPISIKLSGGKSGGGASKAVELTSRGKFDRLRRATAGFTTSELDGYGLRSHLPARPSPIRFLFIGSHLCSALLSGPASRRVLFHPCASLSLHVHHVVKRTYTKLSNLLGTQEKGDGLEPSPFPLLHVLGCGLENILQREFQCSAPDRVSRLAVGVGVRVVAARR